MAKDTSKFTLGRPAVDVYNELVKDREPVLQAARDMAELTVPSLFPPVGWKPGDELPVPEQGIGADCTETMASKLAYVAFPPARIAMSYAVKEYKAKKLTKGEDADVMISKIYAGTAALEEEHRKRLESTGIRNAFTSYLRFLEVGGNALLEWRKINTPVAHRMDKYVVKRDKHGRQVFVILAEECLVEDLPEEQRSKVEAKRKESKSAKKEEWTDVVTIQTVCYRDKGTDADSPGWLLWQEYEGELLQGSEETTPEGKPPPLYAGWMNDQPGFDWGLSYCDPWKSDLVLIEEAHIGLRDGLKKAVEFFNFVRPGVSTKINAIKEAPNGSWLVGDGADISGMPATGKTGDYQFALQMIEDAKRRLGKAFLQKLSLQRSGERVTAEEWKQLGQELDESTGGIHSKLAQTSQRWALLRFLYLHLQEDKFLPDLTRGPEAEFVEVTVATGIDALGRSHEGDQLVQSVGEARDLLPQSYEAKINKDEFLRRLFTSRGVRVAGLVVPDEQLQQQQADQQQQMMAAQAGPAIAQEGAKALFGGMKDAALQNGLDPNAMMNNQQGQ